MVTGQHIVNRARTYKGIPYKYAVKPEDIGTFFDCSSFTQRVAGDLGIPLERSTFLQAAKNGREIPLSEIRPGDLIFYEGDKGHYDHKLLPGKYVGHVVIYTGNGMAIHATGRNGGEGIIEEGLDLIEKAAKPLVMVKRITE